MFCTWVRAREKDRVWATDAGPAWWSFSSVVWREKEDTDIGKP